MRQTSFQYRFIQEHMSRRRRRRSVELSMCALVEVVVLHTSQNFTLYMARGRYVNSSNVTSYVASLLHEATPTNYACMRDAYVHSQRNQTCLITHICAYAHTHLPAHTHTHIQYRIVISFQCFEKMSSSSRIFKCKGTPKHSSKLWPSKNTKTKGNRKENHHVKMEEMTPMRLQNSKEASITVQPIGQLQIESE